jgi:hypothetical protein
VIIIGLSSTWKAKRITFSLLALSNARLGHEGPYKDDIISSQVKLKLHEGTELAEEKGKPHIWDILNLEASACPTSTSGFELAALAADTRASGGAWHTRGLAEVPLCFASASRTLKKNGVLASGGTKSEGIQSNALTTSLLDTGTSSFSEPEKENIRDFYERDKPHLSAQTVNLGYSSVILESSVTVATTTAILSACFFIASIILLVEKTGLFTRLLRSFFLIALLNGESVLRAKKV